MGAILYVLVAVIAVVVTLLIAVPITRKIAVENKVRQDAEKDLKTAPVVFEGTTYLVNSSGAIQKASASSQSSLKPELGKGFKDVKDANDKIWIVDVNGVVQQ